MKILYKKNNDLFLVATPEEAVLVGDSINSNGIISQVLDLMYADLPGILEHILRQSLIPRENVTKEILPDVQRTLETLTDQKLIITKIRGHIPNENNTIVRGIGFFEASREKTVPEILTQKNLFELLDITARDTNLAKTRTSAEPQNISINPNQLGITLITGQKGYGKSYFAKKLLLRLIDKKLGAVVFDPNDEYSSLRFNSDKNQNDYFPVMMTLDPNAQGDDSEQNVYRFRINLSDITAQDFANMFNVPEVSAGEAERYWNEQHRNNITIFQLEDFLNWVNQQEQTNTNFNSFTANALRGRINQATSSGLFGPTNITELLETVSNEGGAVIINLKLISPKWKPHVVNVVLSRIRSVSQNGNPLAVFLEESQLYVDKNSMHYQDLLTRMRHIGIKPFFISNDPRTLPEQVINLADNIFAFGFSSESIIKHLGSSGKTDTDTFATIAQLQKRQCLAIGDMTENYPMYLDILDEENIEMRGETIQFDNNSDGEDKPE